jgi:hypothetical protein
VQIVGFLILSDAFMIKGIRLFVELCKSWFTGIYDRQADRERDRDREREKEREREIYEYSLKTIQMCFA